MRDLALLYAGAFVRALATGLAGVGMGLALAGRGLDPGAASRVVGAGLAGAALAALSATAFADRIGRRRSLIFLAVLSAACSAGFALAHAEVGLVLLAFVGMLNGMGRDRGASLVLEQAMLPACTTDRDRTRAFAWYNVAQDAGHAAGALLAGLESVGGSGASTRPAGAMTFLVVAGLSAMGIVLAAMLTSKVEPPRVASDRPRLSAASKGFLARVSLLFGLDSLGGGFLTTALLSFMFVQRFGVEAGTIGMLFAAARVLNALSHLGAAWLARRIGLVNTMVFTHIPSSLFLVTVAIAPSFGVAAALFLLREGLVEMDVPTRQSYVQAIVKPEERTIASGVTHLVRLAGWAVGPLLSGPLMTGVGLMVPLVVGAALKIVYDVLLYFSFRSVRPPEEMA